MISMSEAQPYGESDRSVKISIDDKNILKELTLLSSCCFGNLSIKIRNLYGATGQFVPHENTIYIDLDMIYAVTKDFSNPEPRSIITVIKDKLKREKSRYGYLSVRADEVARETAERISNIISSKFRRNDIKHIFRGKNKDKVIEEVVKDLIASTIWHEAKHAEYYHSEQVRRTVDGGMLIEESAKVILLSIVSTIDFFHNL